MMMKKAKRVIVTIVAIALLIFGLAGFILPILPGFIFIAVGLVLLSMLSPTVREKIEYQTRKYPKFHAVVVKMENWITKVIGEV